MLGCIQLGPRYSSIETDYLHGDTTALALPARFSLRLRSCGADLLERQLEQLTRHGRTFDVFIRPNLLRDLVPFLWVYDTIRIGLGS